jgi:hypothetical protein
MQVPNARGPTEVQSAAGAPPPRRGAGARSPPPMLRGSEPNGGRLANPLVATIYAALLRARPTITARAGTRERGNRSDLRPKRRV